MRTIKVPVNEFFLFDAAYPLLVMGELEPIPVDFGQEAIEVHPGHQD